MPELRTRRRTLLVAAVTILLTVVPVSSAAAASALTATGLTATVSGASVTVSTKIAASPAATGGYAGICIRSSGQANKDLLSTNVALTTAGVSITKTGTFAAGTYRYWSCAKVGGSWTNIGSEKTFTVGSSIAPSSPSGQSMPVGDLPGWKQIFTDDFTTNVARGSFPGPYAGRWGGYSGPDTSGSGTYNQKIISVSGGLMDLYLHKENGRPQVAAPSPLLNGSWAGQLYGKYTARFRADPLEGYKTAWLLWPSSNIWAQGEVDYPDGQLNGNMWGFNHCIGNPSQNCSYVDSGVGYGAWHTVSIEWSPKGVAFILDGKTLKTATTSIPSVKMFWVLQTETDLANAAGINKDGHLQVDWVTVYSYTG